MTETKVGHTKRDSTDVYIGRGKNGRHMLDTKPTQRGWLGNPFTLDDHDRKESISKFESVFTEKLERDDEFRAAVRELSGKTLGCWCQTVDGDGKACHGEVIAKHADRLAKNPNTEC